MKKYTKPVLREHGTVEQMTKASVNGDFTDADFPATTPRGDITFS